MLWNVGGDKGLVLRFNGEPISEYSHGILILGALGDDIDGLM